MTTTAPTHEPADARDSLRTSSLPGDLTIVPAAEVTAVVEADREGCLDVVRRAYLAHHAGAYSLPHSVFLRSPDRPADRVIALPAHLGGEFNVAGIKWISSCPGNRDRGLPRASGVLVLNDPVTGFPIALLEGAVVSAARTAASAVLAAEALLGGRRTPTVGFIGTGLIARTVADFLLALGWRIGRWTAHDVDPVAAEEFAERVHRSSGAEVGTAGATEVLQTCDLVVVATVSSTPHLSQPGLLDGGPLVLHLSLRDLAPELLRGVQNITDDVEHVLRENTSLDLARRADAPADPPADPTAGLIAGTLGDVLTGALHRDPERATVFSPFGLGLLDVAVGNWVLGRSQDRGRTIVVPDFHGLAR